MMKTGVARSVHVVVTCSSRKRHDVPAHLRLRSLTHRRPAERFAAWTSRLDASTDPRYPAADLYAGEHWQVARSLADVRAVGTLRLWIASAGYGLIPADAAICAYAATFSTPARDAVGVSISEVSDWWRRLGQWPGPATGQPRSFADLASHDPTAVVIVVLSAAYQRACADDIIAAAGLLRPNALSVIGPAKVDAGLADVLVPVTAGVRHTVGGSLQALNVRAAKYILESGVGVNREALRSAALTAVPASPARRAAGRRISDAEVRAYIRSNTHTSATDLLRQLRLSGRSCEQSRFKELHAEACGKVHQP